MDVNVVTVTDKGQISIPARMQKTAGIHKGDKLLLVQTGKRIVVERIDEASFTDLLRHSESVAKKLWGNKADAVWDKL